MTHAWSVVAALAVVLVTVGLTGYTLRQAQRLREDVDGLWNDINRPPDVARVGEPLAGHGAGLFRHAGPGAERIVLWFAASRTAAAAMRRYARAEWRAEFASGRAIFVCLTLRPTTWEKARSQLLGDRMSIEVRNIARYLHVQYAPAGVVIDVASGRVDDWTWRPTFEWVRWHLRRWSGAPTGAQAEDVSAASSAARGRLFARVGVSQPTEEGA